MRVLSEKAQEKGCGCVHDVNVTNRLGLALSAVMVIHVVIQNGGNRGDYALWRLNVKCIVA